MKDNDRPGDILPTGQPATKYDRRETRRAFNLANLHSNHTMQGGRQILFWRTLCARVETECMDCGIEPCL